MSEKKNGPTTGSAGASTVCRGIRGATQAAGNEREAILSATRTLLREIVAANVIEPEDIASIFFTATPDLDAACPPLAARQLGWTLVPLLGAQEIDFAGSLPRTIRVLLHCNTTRSQAEMRHIYINGAEVLRPDLAPLPIDTNAGTPESMAVATPGATHKGESSS
ncbi:MAG: chorismate mutase [Candidatus Promineifilaceae bacterium]|nr:chorismate mutase [Candidatus Promineifilaceae bacterium]